MAPSTLPTSSRRSRSSCWSRSGTLNDEAYDFGRCRPATSSYSAATCCKSRSTIFDPGLSATARQRSRIPTDPRCPQRLGFDRSPPIDGVRTFTSLNSTVTLPLPSHLDIRPIALIECSALRRFACIPGVARGNPVEIRDCPAAVIGNERVNSTGSHELGSDASRHGTRHRP
jgi:hypothetical protein